MEMKPENRQASPQQERCGQTLLLSSLCLGPNQLVWAGSHHCATGSSRFMAKHVFPLEKSRLHVLIRFSTHELIAQHMSKHQHFCLHLALNSVITTSLHKMLPAKSASSERKPFLISEDGEKRDKDRKRDVHRRDGCPHSSCPVKSPHRKFIPAP